MNYLRCIGHGDPVHILAERADQYWFPEELDGIASLVMPVQPILERSSIIFRLARDQHSQTA